MKRLRNYRFVRKISSPVHTPGLGGLMMRSRFSASASVIRAKLNPPAGTQIEFSAICMTIRAGSNWLEQAGLATHQIESYQLEDRFPGPGIVPDYEVPEI